MLLAPRQRTGSGGPRPPEPSGRSATSVLVIAALATAAAVSACLADSARRDRPAADGRTAVSVSAEQALRPPIYRAVYGSADAQLEIKAAEQRLIAQCMSRAGFAYPVHPPSAADGAGSRPKPFGLESLSPPVVQAESERPISGSRSTGEAFTRALYGDEDKRVKATGADVWVSRPATGCVAEAEMHLLGTRRQRWIQLRIIFFEAEREALRRLADDSGYRALNERWRACMREEGYDLADPLRVLAALPRGADTRTHPLARADLECKARTGYFPTAYARLAAVQTTVLAKHPGALADWQSLLRHQRTAARSLPDR